MGVDGESTSSEEEGWLGVSVDDMWCPLPKDPSHTHGWADICGGVEVERIEEHSACRCSCHNPLFSP
jgi:hypothetical protein